MRFLRLFKIIFTLHRYGLYKILKEYHKTSWFASIIETSLFFIPTKYKDKSLPQRTKMAFEELGPVFVKFGQLLSTRQDLIPADYVIELSKLQSQVKPFPGHIAKQIVETSLKTKIEDIFSYFSEEATASASIAQVHKAILKSNNLTVAVKILRPNIASVIKNDVNVLKLAAWFVEKAFRDGKRLRPQEVVEEFKKIITAELDFPQEAANGNELKRLHKKDTNIIIPQVYFDYCTNEVIILEWMDGTPISDLEALRKKGIDLERLSHNGISIFYTQVFHYGFFHADMHPGNILCDDYGRYIGLDFGIVGCLSEEDKRYLAINILAFFNRDYKKVALTHIESGWAPKNTSVEELENSIRAVCEPIFNKPLSQISFGQVLIKLFQVSRRFGIVVQPQLVLLQKTIINVEGLGRILNPNLDLWVTAKPILEKWMKQQMGWRGLINNLKDEIPYLSYTLPKMPRMLANSLISAEEIKEQSSIYIKLIKSYKRQNRFLIVIIIAIAIAFWYKLN
ncbi:MAG: ubiquinone biosynthesis regulatory protein kinase UbiB [Proteobacteria bacterium]|jgi:ubiquinone biosynthesis protein|nr:ubiquinone biosynthesis regulatory protein kinase UbiB [Pseudomonadota bacterium]